MKFVSRKQLWVFALTIFVVSSVWQLPPVARAQWQRWRGEREFTMPPRISAEASLYEPEAQRLTLRGAHFDPQAEVTLLSANGQIAFRSARIVNHASIIIEGVEPLSGFELVTITVTNPMASGQSTEAPSSSIVLPMSAPLRRSSNTPTINVTRNTAAPDQAGALSIAEVQQVIAQAVAEADAQNLKVTISVVDSEGNALGTFAMTGAAVTTRVGGNAGCVPTGCATLPLRCGLEGVCVPACAASLAKAVTGSFLSSRGHAFSTRTASFIVQEHFPPGVNFQGSGPLFGVQFSQLLCSDVNARSALGLSADPGGLPLYKNGVKVGGVGIEGDGRYVLAESPALSPAEEIIALAATRNFAAPDEITGDKIIVNGIRFPYVKAATPPARTVLAFGSLAGTTVTCLGLSPAVARASLPSEFVTATLGDAPAGRINTRLFPAGAASFTSSVDLSAAEVTRLLVQAAKQAFLTRAAIRQPLNSAAEVNITVCDADGKILGIFSTADAPLFGFDVSAQKARSAAFFSHADAANRLRNAGFGAFVNASEQDGLRLTGSQAFSDRAIGFLARPFYPDGIDRTPNGPYSVPIANFSPFNLGLQLSLIQQPFFENLLMFIDNGNVAAGTDALTKPCPSAGLGSLANGLQIFPGSVPLYKNGKLVGAIGISGDGVDQDDLISAMGSTGFEAPENLRTDQVFVRGTRLPYVKFPRNPNRD